MPEIIPPAQPTVQDLINAITAALRPAAPPPPSTTLIQDAVTAVESEIANIKTALGATDAQVAATASFFGSAHGLARVAEYVVGGLAVVGVLAIAGAILRHFGVM